MIGFSAVPFHEIARSGERAAGLAWFQGGQPRVVFDFTLVGGKVVQIVLIADPERIGELGVTTLGV